MAVSTGAPAVAAPVPAVATPAAAPSAEPAVVQPTTYETLSDDDQIIFDLQKEHEAKVIADTPDKAEPAPTKSKKGGKEPAKEPAPTSSAIVKYKSPEEAVTAIVTAIESGDAKKIAKALGKPEAFLDSSNAKWVAFREQQNAVRERDKQITQREHEYNTRVAEARAELGPAIKAAKAYRDGNFAEFVTLVQELTGESYDDAQRKVIQGEIAIDPNVKKLRAELQAERLERAKEREEAKKVQETEQQKAQYEQAVQAVSEQLANHRISKVKGFQRGVLTKVRDSWSADENTYTMSFEEAADAIMEQYDAEVEAMGYTRAQAAPAPKALPPAPVVPPRSRAADARPADIEPWADPDAPDMDDDQILESIRRDIKSGRLK